MGMKGKTDSFEEPEPDIDYDNLKELKDEMESDHPVGTVCFE